VFGLAPGLGPFHQILKQRHPHGIILASGCGVSAPHGRALALAFTPLAQERGGYFLSSYEPSAALPLLTQYFICTAYKCFRVYDYGRT